jgi:hypothetical protein|eukprot:CAMPEP_0169115358 /NCGR_PEP_ID=MMETSP1015-20121227/29294_1 /TAXON_ID=342587 /ORGANISM="Karlodinium micrum, Strain CCMP2283" /LENGTH=424 /DNA_ID=CAMNT_0009177793 /DNA_START=98 /DNA_END=1372 /DNA_ORIENTATION=+
MAAVQMGQDAPTSMADLFLSGYDDVKFEPDETNPEKNVMKANMSWRQSFGFSGGAGGPNPNLALYVPDPPCILPFEDEEQIEEADTAQLDVPTYWKNYAGWLQYWPKLKEHREAIESFRSLWANRPVGSRLRGYVVVSPNSIGVRHRPTYDEEQRNGQIIRTGTCMGIEAIKEDTNTRFLKLPGPGAGWVFDKYNDQEVMAEMKSIDVGQWWYRVVSQSPLETRSCPTSKDEARNGWLLSYKEVVVVNLRCKVGGYTFFHLADGRGWMFELKPGTVKNDKSLANVVMTPCEDDFVDGGDQATLKSLVPPTNEVVEVGMWTYIVDLEPVLAIGTKRNGFYIRPGDVVKVDKRANSNGNPQGIGGPGIQNRRWLRLGGNQGWVPEIDERGKTLMNEQSTDEVGYPTWFKPNDDVNKPKEPWHVGVV